MNCEPGDLAIMVKSYAGNEGKIFHCVRLATMDELMRDSFDTGTNWWLIDRAIPSTWGELAPYADDKNLRPIRPGDMSDETPTDIRREVTA